MLRNSSNSKINKGSHNSHITQKMDMIHEQRPVEQEAELLVTCIQPLEMTERWHQLSQDSGKVDVSYCSVPERRAEIMSHATSNCSTIMIWQSTAVDVPVRAHLLATHAIRGLESCNSVELLAKCGRETRMFPTPSSPQHEIQNEWGLLLLSGSEDLP